MKLTKQTILLLLGFLFIFSIHPEKILAQETVVKPSVDRGSIESRFDYVIHEANTFEDSKIIKGWWLSHLKIAVLDSMKALHTEIIETNKILSAKKAEIDSLNSGLLSVNNQLSTVNTEKNSIKFVGMSMSKSSYNSLMWSILIGLAFLLLIFIALYKRSQVVTTQTKTDLDELKIEFDAFRKKALEREEKIVRKYHDELSRYKGNS
jgi:hypothetical protein